MTGIIITKSVSQFPLQNVLSSGVHSVVTLNNLYLIAELHTTILFPLHEGDGVDNYASK